MVQCAQQQQRAPLHRQVGWGRQERGSRRAAGAQQGPRRVACMSGSLAAHAPCLQGHHRGWCIEPSSPWISRHCRQGGAASVRARCGTTAGAAGMAAAAPQVLVAAHKHRTAPRRCPPHPGTQLAAHTRRPCFFFFFLVSFCSGTGGGGATAAACTLAATCCCGCGGGAWPEASCESRVERGAAGRAAPASCCWPPVLLPPSRSKGPRGSGAARVSSCPGSSL